MNTNTKITGNDTSISAIMKLSDGSTGALMVCMDMMEQSPTIDPDSAMGGIAPLLSLDIHNIYGLDIWMLYTDVCGENITKMLACLRACQLGIITETALKYAISNRGKGIDTAEVLKDVQERLPAFGKEAQS